MAFGFRRLYPPKDHAARAFYEIWITLYGNQSPMRFAKTLDSKIWWRFHQLLVKTADEGKIRNEEMYKHIGDGIWEFKARTARLYCFDDERRIILTHGGKHTDRAVEERKKAGKIQVEYRAWKGRGK